MEDRKAGLVKVRNNAAVTETEKIPVDSKTVAKVVSLLEKSNIPFNKQQFLGMIFFQLNGKEDFFSFPTTCGLASITFACNSNAGSTASIEIKGMQSRSGIEYPIFFDSLPDELKSQALQDCYANILQIPVGKLDIFKQLVAVVDGQQAVECLMKNEFSLDIKYRGKKLSDRNVQAAAEDPINRVPRNIENLFIRLALQLPEDQHWCQNVLKEVYLFERVGNIFNVVTLMIPYEILSLDLSIIDRDKKLKKIVIKLIINGNF